jgi:predicted transcriptional regulator
MSKELHIHIGDSLDEMGRRFVDAWHRAERGDLTAENAERHAGFRNVETFSSVLTPRRLEMLRHVRAHPARSIRALSLALGRDYRRVHADVEALTAAGLMDRDETGLHIDYDTARIETSIDLR